MSSVKNMLHVEDNRSGLLRYILIFKCCCVYCPVCGATKGKDSHLRLEVPVKELTHISIFAKILVKNF